MYYIGVDIGGMSIKFGIVDEKGRLLNKNVLSVDYKRYSVPQVIEMMKEKMENLCAQARIGIHEIAGLGIGCPGPCDVETGILCNANNMGWKNVPVVDLFKDMQIPTFIDNDANAALVGEAKFGAAKDYKNVVLFTLGTGLGGALMIDGKMYYGEEGKGAELGHMILDINGRQCSCGHHGCWEAYASVTALIKDTKDAMNNDSKSLMWDYCNGNIDSVNGKTAFEVANNTNDVSARKVVDNYILYLSEGIRSYCNIFRPQAIIIGGGLSGQKEKLTGPIIAKMEEWEWGQKECPAVKILVSELGNDAGIIGAAALAMK